MEKIIFIGFILFNAISLPAYAQLPQNHPWEVTLRNYMKTLTIKDFEVPLKPLTWNPELANNVSNDQLYRWWLGMHGLPSTKEFRMDPKYFLLSNIEGNDGKIHMRIGRNSLFDVDACAWWAYFDYPGNPHYNEKAVKLRALIPAMVDMMMLTRNHEQGHNHRSDFAGGNLIEYAYAYYVGQDILPSNVRAAYLEGMREMRNQIIDWGPTGIFGDMDSFALVGMWYIAKATNDSSDIKAAKGYTDTYLKRWFYPAGYFGHGNAFDATYNGMDLLYLTWTALISDYAPLKEDLNKAYELKEHLTVEDYDPSTNSVMWNGPSHFSTATSGPVSYDQGASYARQVGAAMITKHAYPLVIGNGQSINKAVIPNTSDLINSVVSISTYEYWANKTFNVSSDYVPQDWSESHWVSSIPYDYDFYETGFYDTLTSIVKEKPALFDNPYNRKENFIKHFDNKDRIVFTVAKLGGFGVIIHTGRLSNWGGATGRLSGLSGGALSTFWTPSTGTVINGVATGYQNPDQQDTWDIWRQWSVNAISGLTSDDKPFSSARNRFPDTDGSSFSNN